MGKVGNGNGVVADMGGDNISRQCDERFFKFSGFGHLFLTFWKLGDRLLTCLTSHCKNIIDQHGYNNPVNKNSRRNFIAQS
jgi:hypothetical protein